MTGTHGEHGTEAVRGAVRVVRGGEVVVERARGPAGEGRDCRPESVFQVASVSKQFAAASALLLAEDGYLSLHDPVRRWFPSWPRQWSRVTVHHLLTHTSGVGHWGDLWPSWENRLPSREELLATVAAAPPTEAPLPRPFRYSSPGFVVLAAVLERAGGAPYRELVAERIFRPLRMQSTSAGQESGEDVAEGRHNGEAAPSVQDLTDLVGTGDVRSTVGDLSRFGEALHDGALLDRFSLDAMFEPHAAVGDGDGDVRAVGYGYGCFLGTVAGHPARFHTGDNPGYRSFLGRLPELDATVVVLSNEETADVNRLAASLVRTAFGPGPG
ncbi:serine hydrolase domain-containing protein [Streptomyces sp. TR02-1]|uniref:serine hydrolase domain-containing protein n=1 Tax=Streptomyces sp. TR02-1 TaxID=3385977 RepID=UPI00399F8D6F